MYIRALSVFVRREERKPGLRKVGVRKGKGRRGRDKRRGARNGVEERSGKNAGK